MAEPDSDPRNTMEDEDLEDGEIETDEENEVAVIEVKQAKPIVEPPAKKPKPAEETDSKKPVDVKVKSERNSTTENSAKNKKLGSNDVPKGKNAWTNLD